MEKKKYFNLLKPIAPPKSFWDKIYDWIVLRARVVIIIAELFIAIAFVAKVIVDTNSKNLNKSIDNLSKQVQFYETANEANFRDIQRKTSDYTALWNNSSGYTPVLQEIYTYTSNQSMELIIRIEGTTISVYGYDDLSDVKTLETLMKDSSSFVKGSVSVDDLTLEERELIQNTGQFVLSAELKDFLREGI